MTAPSNTPEKFTWAIHVTQAEHLIITIGPGYLVMNAAKDPNATGSPKDMTKRAIAGTLLSSTAMLRVTDGTQERWVLIERDAGAPNYAGHWQFPAGRISPGEMPLQCAKRELVEEVLITNNDVQVPLEKDVTYQLAGESCEWVDGPTSTAFHAEFVEFDNTLEFFTRATLEVADINQVDIKDNEVYQRQVRLFSASEIEELFEQGLLCPSSALQWRESQVIQEHKRDEESENGFNSSPYSRYFRSACA